MARGPFSGARDLEQLRATSGFSSFSRSDPRYSSDATYRSAVHRAEYLGRDSTARRQGYAGGYSDAMRRRRAGQLSAGDTTSSRSPARGRRAGVQTAGDGSKLVTIGPRGGGTGKAEAELGKLVARVPGAMVDVTVTVRTRSGLQTHTMSVAAVQLAGGGGVLQGVADAWADKIEKSPKNKGPRPQAHGAYQWTKDDLTGVQISWNPNALAVDAEQEHYELQALAEQYAVALDAGEAGSFFDNFDASTADAILDAWEAMAWDLEDEGPAEYF